MAALLKANPKLDVGTFATGLNVWDRIEEWEDDGRGRPAGMKRVSPEEAHGISRRDPGHELRAAPATEATMPRPPPSPSRRARRKAMNNILLAEAGTGLGKTLGYLAPAWLWAQEEQRAGLGLHLHQKPAAPARPGNRAAGRRTRRSGARQHRHPQGARKLSLPAQHAGGLRPAQRAPIRAAHCLPR